MSDLLERLFNYDRATAAYDMIEAAKRIEALEAALQPDHIIRVVLRAHGFSEDKLNDLTWLRTTHAYAIASRVAAALASTA